MASFMTVRTASIVGLLAVVALAAGCGRSQPLGASVDPGAGPTEGSEQSDGPVDNGTAHSEDPNSEDAAEQAGDEEGSAKPENTAVCPLQSGDAVEYVVGFHEWPDNFEVGQEFLCGRITYVSQPPPPDAPTLAFVAVDVWDEGDFLARTSGDSNVRYAERNDAEPPTCTGTGCPGGPPASDEPPPSPDDE